MPKEVVGWKRLRREERGRREDPGWICGGFVEGVSDGRGVGGLPKEGAGDRGRKFVLYVFLVFF